MDTRNYRKNNLGGKCIFPLSFLPLLALVPLSDSFLVKPLWCTALVSAAIEM